VRVPPREYALAAELLAAAVEQDSPGGSRRALHEIARRFGAAIGMQRHAREGGGPGGRDAVENVLAGYGFEPVRGKDGTIRLRNCPFHELAARHRDVVCGMALSMVEGLVEGEAGSELRPVLDPDPERCCVVIAAGAVGL
jgi:predicted ArsR family transcriptional regulator